MIAHTATFSLRSNRFFLIIATTCAVLICGLVVSLFKTQGAQDTFEPLLKSTQWMQSGGSERFTDPVSKMEIPRKMSGSSEFVLWRTWSPDRGAFAASIVSEPFPASRFMAIPIIGFPHENAGTRIFLKCVASGEIWDVGSERTNNQWSTVYVDMQAKSCASLVTLNAVNSGSNSFIGVGTPFKVSGGAFEGHNGFGPRALTIFLAWLACVTVVSIVPFLYGIKSPAIALPVGMSALAGFGMFEIVVHAAPPELRSILRYSFIVGAIFCCTYLVLRRPAADRSLNTIVQLVPSFLVWLLVAMFYAAIVSSGDNGAGAWSINGLFSPLRWSTDNQLPYLFAEALIERKPPAEIQWGPWLASDRTPLMTGLLLVGRQTFFHPLIAHLGTDFLPTAYMMASIAILTSWVPVIIWLGSIARLRSLWSLLILTSTSPFFFFNSVFAWGKLLGGSYAALAFGLLFLMSRNSVGKSALILIAACASASYLSHASNVFALIPIALFYSRTILRGGVGAIALGSMVAVMMASPWFYWLGYLQVGGSSLLRYFLTGDFGFDRREASVARDVVEAYRNLGWLGFVSDKLRAIQFMIGLNVEASSLPEVKNTPAGFLSSRRILDFFVLSRVAWMALLVPLISIFTTKQSSRAGSLAIEACGVGLAGIVLSLTVSLAPSYLHHQAYGAVILLIVGGGICISEFSAAWQSIIIGLSTIYFSAVWIVSSLINLPVLFPAAIFYIAAFVSLMIFLCCHSRLNAAPHDYTPDQAGL